MAVLNIYDKFGKLLEVHHFDGSLKSWIKSNVDNYQETVRPPYSATLNGNHWGYSRHDEILNDNDIVDLSIEPADPFTVAYVIIAVASAAYAYNLASNIPKGYQNTVESGQSIYKANARLNSIKPNGIVREAAGKYPIFPDLICPVRRKYIDHEEFLYLMMCISSGYMFIREKNFYIAETPITNYQGDYTLNIYEPGDTVTGNAAHENWFESKEVLDLELITSTNEIPGNWTATYSGDTITTFLDGSLQEFPFSVDALIEITSGSNQGVYTVAAIGSPNHTATLVKQQKDSSNEISTILARRLGIDAASRTSSRVTRRLGGRGIIRTYSNSTTSPITSLTSVSPAESITFKALNGGTNWEGPYEVIPENETARYMEVDITFPGGLVEVDSNNNQINRSVEIDIQYRDVGSVNWTSAVDTSRSPNTLIFTDNTFDARGYTVEIDMGSSIRPEVRFRRVTKDTDSISITDDVYITRVKCKLETPTSYANVTTAALILRGTNALAATSENKINVRGASRKLPTLTEIENAANGTPYDISSSATQTTTDYLINSNEIYLGATQVNFNNTYPYIPAGIPSVHFSPNGLIMLTFDGTYVRSYTLNTAFNPRDGFTYSSYGSVAVGSTGKNAMWADSGTKLFVLSKQSDPSSNSIIDQYTISTAYDLSTISSTPPTSYTTSSEITNGECFYIQDNGLKFWICDGDEDLTGKVIEQYTMSTPFDLSTGARDGSGSPITYKSLNVATQLNTYSPNETMTSFWMGDYTGSPAAPSKLWVKTNTNRFLIYSLSTPGDISTASFTGAYTVDNYTGVYFNVWADYLVSASGSTYTKISPNEVTSVILCWLLDKVSDSRESRSIARFAANAIYDAIDSEAADTVDWTALSTLDNTLTTVRGDYFDGEFVDETTLWEALKVLFAPGYTEPAMKEGKLTPIRVVNGTNYNHLYTPDIMLNDGLIITDSHYDATDPDGVDVEYLDEDSGEVEVVECRLSGDAGLRPKRIQAIGITNRTRAWRYGMIDRRRMFYKPANYSFTTEMDGLNSEYGDAIGIASDIFTSQTGAVIGHSGNVLTLDFVPEFSSSSPAPIYYAALRNPEGEFSGLFTIVGGSPNNTITITSSPGIDFTPLIGGSPEGDNTLITIGTSDEWGVRAIVRNITPQGEDTVEILAEEYVSNIWSDIDGAP